MIWLDYIVFSLLILGLLLVIIRLVIGPKLADRIVALDTFNMIVIGIIVFIALLQNSILYLDIAIVYGILAFLEIVVFARYVEGKNNDHR
ncbi:MAG: cation:proton antiporter [Tenericutes bacterium GWC2_34_14]|nr:MAG: cation:proton antiporter [Tenericutes bacterium GWC2_34_14]OHE33321.1 MAG: cation:proton antiporter [Tenericutes bacterium GWE2_34_108]OHE36472.1 MAG: cation:proton antiporter [Tenericutes bacterium GWF1_35_14]OHE37676.1 MAG: cation:proton antiporter [Tenericutes bacterium GWF2_35_184]OHE45047.1 MAG: cation:proton antiporter [Tenericutes bacterium RIFOXYA2_FULL_36_32]OHE45855.1 MAG: cation:proton antiporter [Tenericutes bacterium RIFOXYA12_FULL_35_10]OHE49059.1 MAG: cation:proton anti